MNTQDFLRLLDRAVGGRVVFLTGAGISAESGIPTFRGEEGYWTVGSRVYRPMELATHSAFLEQPREVWRWYLYRRTVCNRAAPNDAHHALARLERAMGEQFDLITQNVDGLHLRAGNSLERTYQIHGNTDLIRSADGSPGMFPMPEGIPSFEKDTPLTDDVWEKLVTPAGKRARPHVLWFDEYYDEAHFRAHSAVHAAGRCDLMVIVGTAGATSLPHQCVEAAAMKGAVIIDVNPNPNPFSEFVSTYPHGAWMRSAAGQAVPAIVTALLG
ncbi:MAG: Sir2 family NAD-dependent protein deacetylase [Myxococcota bacterium]